MSFQIGGDLDLDVNQRVFRRGTGVTRVISRLRALFEIARGSYEYKPDGGVRWFETIGSPANRGRLEQIIREAAVTDPEVLDVRDFQLTYLGGRAYSCTCKFVLANQTVSVTL